MDNMKIWSAVEETDPKFTKVTHDMMTSINGSWLFKRATEQFGPIGIGWGYEILEERYDQGVLIEGTDTRTSTHTLKVKLWYKWGEDKGEIVNYGHTPYIMRTKKGCMVDGEAPKKSLTDALKKCLSMLGFSADVHMGQYDDKGYVEEMRMKSEIEHADDKDEMRIKQAQEYQAWLNRELETYPLIENIKALETVHKGHIRKAARRKDEAGQRLLVKAYEVQKEKLTKEKKDETLRDNGKL